MRTILVIDTSTGEDAELDHEDLQTITDALTRERARTLKQLEQFPPLNTVGNTEATAEELVGREKVLTWASMLGRVLTKLA